MELKFANESLLHSPRGTDQALWHSVTYAHCQRPTKNRCLRTALGAVLATALLLSSVAVGAKDAAPFPLKIEGVEKALAKQLISYAGEPSSQSPSALRHWQRTVEQRLKQVLAALGYNNATLKSTLSSDELQLQLSLGKATTYSNVDVRLIGQGEASPQLTEFIYIAAPKRTQQLVHADYEAFKADLLAIALTLGYFDAQYSEHRLAVSRKRSQAELKLVLDSGTRHRYGPVTFSDSELSPEFLQRWVPFEAGEPYNATGVDKLARDLRDSGYFGSVRVRPDLDRAEHGTVPIQVEAPLREPHSAAVGIGYGTDTGPRLRGSLTRHYVNRHGHSAGLDTELSADSQELTSYYRMPHHPDPANHYLQLDVGIANLNIDDASSLRYTLGGKHHRINSAAWQENYSLKFQHETSELEGIKTRTRLLIPGVSWSRERSRRIAGWGTLKYSVDAQFSAAREALLSDIDFDRFYLKLGSGHAFSEKQLLHARLELGWIESDRFSEVPLSLRFYAGGDDSIRGFARRAVSPTDAEGNAIGGRYLTTLSLEYEYRLRDSLGVAVFVDTGRAGYNELDPIAYGGGVGLRWYSPVGPIKVYVGVPLSGDDKSARLHFSIGG